MKIGHGYNNESFKEKLNLAAQNHAVRTNYVKIKIDVTQQNSRGYVVIEMKWLITV